MSDRQVDHFVAVEGYPMLTQPGQVIAWEEIHVGMRAMFADAGFREVTRPGIRSLVVDRSRCA